jgi:hypothetical protein
MTDTPVLLIVFNRPDKVEQMVAALREIKPSTLYIAADGPRDNRPTDSERCTATRAVIETIDWPCTVHKRYQDKNLGCKIGVSSAITWFFENVEAGIILEDDCIPTLDFFLYATDMLTRYQDSTVMHINGTTFTQATDSLSYHFSHIPLVWGWATWRRAWQHYDVAMTTLPQTVQAMRGRNMFNSSAFRAFWTRLFMHIITAQVDTWDAQWVHTVFAHNGICITPRSNLIHNIGFDTDATHTTESVAFARPHERLPFPLNHPATLAIDTAADTRTMYTGFIRSVKQRIKYQLIAVVTRA